MLQADALGAESLHWGTMGLAPKGPSCSEKPSRQPFMLLSWNGWEMAVRPPLCTLICLEGSTPVGGNADFTDNWPDNRDRPFATSNELSHSIEEHHSNKMETWVVRCP